MQDVGESNLDSDDVLTQLLCTLVGQRACYWEKNSSPAREWALAKWNMPTSHMSINSMDCFTIIYVTYCCIMWVTSTVGIWNMCV